MAASRTAAEVFELLRPGLDDGSMLLVSDFDGTLSSLVGDPWSAAMLPAARRALRRLAVAPGVDVVLLSGRVVADLASRARVGGVTYLGDHGTEWATAPRGFRAAALRIEREAADPAVIAMADRLKVEIPARIGQTWLILEDKGPGLTFHYRSAPDHQAARRDLLAAVEAVDPGSLLDRRPGPRACELRPPGATTKGVALARLIEQRRPGFVVMLGDDRNDAMAFDTVREARARGAAEGLAVAVAGHPDITVDVVPHADVALASPHETARLLGLMARHVKGSARA